MPQSDGNRETTLEKSLIELAVESWRMARVFSRALTKLDAGEGNRYASQLRYFQQRLEEYLQTAGLRAVSLEGQPFDPGIAASAVNLGDFGPEDDLLVDQMLEPIIMGEDGVKKQGTLVLRKAQA